MEDPKVSPIPVAKVLSRLVDDFEEPLVLAASQPGYADYEVALAADGWLATSEPLVLLKIGHGKDERWGIISGVHILAAAKKVCKETVPCFFIARAQVPIWQRVNAEGGLQPPRASTDEDEELLLLSAHWR
jgi:hypothetical protein